MNPNLMDNPGIVSCKKLRKIHAEVPQQIDGSISGILEVPSKSAADCAVNEVIRTAGICYETVGEMTIDKLPTIESNRLIFKTTGAYYIEHLPEPPKHRSPVYGDGE